MKEVLITSSILILVMVAARQIFRGKVKHSLIYGMWLLVALRLLIPVQFGAFRFSFLTTAQPLTQAITEVTQNPVVGPSRQEIYQSIEQVYVQHGQPVTTPEVQQQIQTQVEQTITAPTIGQVLTVLWLVGAGCMAIWFALVNLRLHRRLRQGGVALEGVESPIPVLVSARVTSPCLVGLLRPVIYLTPESAQSHNLTHVLTHELTHYRHKDHLWALLRCVCLCLYWFHPLVWLSAFLSRRDCELACDEGALKILGEHQRIAYGKTLLEIVSHAQARGHLLQTATTMNESKRQLKERVNYIVKKPKVWITAAIAMVLVCAICFGCAISGGSPDTPENTDHTPTSAIPTASSTTPTEPPTEPDDDPSGISLTEEQLDQANLEIRTMSSTNVHLFFYLYYTHPQGLDLDAFLQIYPARTRATAQEQSLAETYIHNIRGETCYRFDKSVIDGDLSRWLGITSDALYHGPTQNLVYLEEYQAYFYFGYQTLGYFTCTGGSIQGDTLYLYNDKQKVELVQRNGEWQFVSSLPASVTISPKETLLSAEQLYPARITFVSEAYTKNGDTIGVTATPESCLFMSYYSSPEELDLGQFLRNAPDSTAATPEEEQAAMALLGLSGDRSPSPCHKFRKSQVDELLMKWYGITSDGLYQGPSFDLVYMEAYDAYYNFTSDFAAGVFQCIGGTISGDTAYLYSIHGKLTLERVGETWYIRAYEPISTSNA